MKIISISKFKAACLELLQRVYTTGNHLLITKNNKPIAMVMPPPVEKPKKSAFGCMADEIEIKGDIIKPVAQEDWEVL